jgi:MFS transporter, YNFM family, putative membrane transport protein
VYAAQPLLPLLAATFRVSKAAAGLTVSAPNVAVALAAPFAGVLAGRLGRRRVIVGALFALALPTLLAATSQSLPALVGWRFAQGIAVPGVYAVGVAYAASAWPPRSVGTAMAALVTGNVLGGFFGRAVAGVAAEVLGWRAAFVALALLTLAGAALTHRSLPRAGPEAVPAGLGAELRRMRHRALDRQLLATFAVGFSVLFVQVAMFTYVTYHLAAPPYGLGAGALSSIFAVYLFGAVVTPFAGRWIGRIGPRRVLALAAGVGVAGSALTLAPPLPLIVAGLALFCTAVFVSQSAATSHLQAAAPQDVRSVASGLYISAYYLGGAAGGVLPAAAWHLGGWKGCVGLVVAVQLTTLALAVRFWSDRAAPPGLAAA